MSYSEEAALALMKALEPRLINVQVFGEGQLISHGREVQPQEDPSIFRFVHRRKRTMCKVSNMQLGFSIECVDYRVCYSVDESHYELIFFVRDAEVKKM